MTDINPLLKKVTMPGKRFRLPSRGLFYTRGELADSVVDGEVEIFSMTTVDEITLRSPEFLFSGEAIEKVFRRCIPEVNEPLKLLSQDVDYLLTCLRVVSYGGVLQLDLRCDKCQEEQKQKNKREIENFMAKLEKEAEENNISLETALQDTNVANRLEVLEKRQAPKETYNINLDGILSNQTTELNEDDFKKYTVELSNGQKVFLTPLRLDSAVMAYRFQNEDLSKDLTIVEDYITFLLASRIKEVDSISDMKLIDEWVRNLPVSLKDELNNKAGKLEPWGTKFDYSITCGGCGDKRNIDTLLNPINFFILPSRSEGPNS